MSTTVSGPKRRRELHRFQGREARIERDLNEASSVPQIDEYQLAEVALAVDPAAEADLGAGVGARAARRRCGCEWWSQVMAMTASDVFGHGAICRAGSWSDQFPASARSAANTSRGSQSGQRPRDDASGGDFAG